VNPARRDDHWHTVLTGGDVQAVQGVVSEDIVNVPMCDERLLPQPWRAV
jgi:hypothetical protein